MRKTMHVQLVLSALHEHGEQFGLQIAERTDLRSGTVYPIFRRLEEAGWVTSRSESFEDARDQGRPPRTYYKLTELGEKQVGSKPQTSPRTTPDKQMERLGKAMNVFAGQMQGHALALLGNDVPAAELRSLFEAEHNPLLWPVLREELLRQLLDQVLNQYGTDVEANLHRMADLLGVEVGEWEDE